MTDIRRSILWVVFSASLFLIWDAWNKHNGQPSFFGPPPARVAAPATIPASSVGLPTPSTATGPTAADADARLRRRRPPRPARADGGDSHRDHHRRRQGDPQLDRRAPWSGSSC